MVEAGWFARPVEIVARELIGWTLLLDGIGGRIVETEAYGRHDPASHSCRGPTARNAAMFGLAGRLYVYRSYGLHWCANVVAGTVPGEAVLLRALEPERGLEIMRARRGVADPRALCGGPGRLTAALGIGAEQNGADLLALPFALLPPPSAAQVVTSPRIGISKATAVPWRFAERGSRFLSRPVPAGTVQDFPTSRNRGPRPKNGLA